MNSVRVAAVIAALAVLSGCGTTSSTHPRSRETSCVNAGSVQPATPVVQVRTGSEGLHTISQVTTVGCRDWVRVAGPTAAANVTFTATVQCTLTQIGPGQPAYMQIRNPQSALFTLEPGQVSCVFANPQEIPMCGTGIVFPGGGSSGLVECSDPLFKVAVHSGSMRVVAPNHQSCVVTAGHRLRYNFLTRKPVLAEVSFPKAEIRLFNDQAKELGLPLATSSPSFQPACAPA
jgi:hypothetical protein